MVPSQDGSQEEDDDVVQVYGDMFEKLQYREEPKLTQSEEEKDEQEPASELGELIQLHRKKQREWKQRNRKESVDAASSRFQRTSTRTTRL